MYTKTYDRAKILKPQDSLVLSVAVSHSGLYSIDITLSSTTDWARKNNESCLVTIKVMEEEGDFQHSFHLATYMGLEKHMYCVNIGYLPKGIYSFNIECMDLPILKAADLFVHDFSLKLVQLEEELRVVYEHAPILYGRNHFTAYDAVFTDTPLALMYSVYETRTKQIEIEYHVVFSHEDEGTPGKLLMSKWGRCTDIEWCYTVVIDALTREVAARRYQGPQHEVRMFTGAYLPNTQRPILQARTTNGNFDHCIDSTYCFALHPTIRWNKGKEPREWFMKDQAYINAVMIKEAERQLGNHSDFMHQIAHPTKYVYAFFFLEVHAGDTVIDLFYLKDNHVISSSYDYYDHLFEYGTYTGGNPFFTIAIEAEEEMIKQFNIRLLQGDQATIKKVQFCRLEQTGEMKESLTIEGPIVIDNKAPCIAIEEFAAVWKKQY